MEQRMAHKRGPLVVVNWEPVLHMVAASTPSVRYQENTMTYTQCGRWVTGYVDDNADLCVTCLSCLGTK